MDERICAFMNIDKVLSHFQILIEVVDLQEWANSHITMENDLINLLKKQILNFSLISRQL